MTAFPYSVIDVQAARLGLIVLRVDETIEQDFRRIFAPDAVQFHITRVSSGDALTPDTIALMKTQLGGAAALLPPAVQFDVVGYGCTSGTAMIGAAKVRDLIEGAASTRDVTNPLSAALAAMDALNIRRIGIVSPYIEAVAQPLSDSFQSHGISVIETLSFGEEVEARVARIDPQSIAQAARALAARNDIDGVFVSCTNLKTLDIIDDLERELDLPVLSSNQVLAWHMARLSGAPTVTPPGRLFHV